MALEFRFYLNSHPNEIWFSTVYIIYKFKIILSVMPLNFILSKGLAWMLAIVILILVYQLTPKIHPFSIISYITLFSYFKNDMHDSLPISADSRLNPLFCGLTGLLVAGRLSLSTLLDRLLRSSPSIIVTCKERLIKRFSFCIQHITILNIIFILVKHLELYLGKADQYCFY